ncbi:uncharacterized protein LOC134534571 [Bacillus rossius redtenbacheri]|uniref:uncharacterized protein LOC134534571 n=1 Tax=Bacillus rossius redtenbacheri TaxID=93214 RepID=UPI002FDD9111
MNGSHHWLVFSDTPLVPVEVDKLRLRLDSELVWVTRESGSGTFTFHDLYKIDHNWPVVDTVTGTWHMSTGLRYNLAQWKYHPSRRGNLQGLNLLGVLIVTNISTENIHEEILKPETKDKDLMAVYNYRVNMHIRRMFNFT